MLDLLAQPHNSRPAKKIIWKNNIRKILDILVLGLDFCGFG
jgi:hypothetical protein